MSAISDRVSALDKRCIVLETENNLIETQIKELTERNSSLFDRINMSVESIDFIEHMAKQERLGIKGKIEKVITKALVSIYGDEYSVEFDYSMKRMRTNVNVFLVKKSSGGDIRREMGGFGGGVADTISLPLKLLVLIASKSSDKILVADEPGKHLDANRVERFFEFLKQLSDKMNIQMIVNSHHTVATDYADVVYEVSIFDNVSCAKKVK